MVNLYHIYAIDRDFGPFFLKFCNYFPYNAQLCLEWPRVRQRQLAKEGIAFEAPDSGIQTCGAPQRPPRYRVTDLGWHTAGFFTRPYNRLLWPGLAAVLPGDAAPAIPVARAFETLDQRVQQCLAQHNLAA
jgi:hypothetical protein